MKKSWELFVCLTHEVEVIEDTPQSTWMSPRAEFMQTGGLPEYLKEPDKLKALKSKYML